MATEITSYVRGSEWRQWDLHIHTPASFHWNGKRFDSNPDSLNNIALVDEMIKALNDAEPEVFALMDYWTFDGWFALQRRLAQPDAPNLNKIVFPGIELRLVSPMDARLNAHVIFSNNIKDQILQDFKSQLIVELINRPLSNDALIELSRHVGIDKVELHGAKKEDVDVNDDIALNLGSQIAEINCDSYKKAILNVADGFAIGFMPFNTSDGLAEIKWQEHYAYCLGLFNSSPIFETRDHDTWGAFVGQETEGNSQWIGNFQRALGGIPRLAISGSDAHQFIGEQGNNDKRGYGDFPSEKITWIKADPTFHGLLQAIKEPAKRSFIGRVPPKLSEINENKTYFIDNVQITKNILASSKDTWLDGCNLPLNSDLVAIIGNKGSGKSALADVIALLGNSQQSAHFSFLKKGRFRGKSGEPAKSFDGKLTWYDDNNHECNLNDNSPEDQVELVRYIPQGHFENLCNNHVSQSSDAFENELRDVIFSHAGDEVRLGALDFNQLIEFQESSFRDQLGEYRKDLKKLNQDIAWIEDQLQPEVKNSLNEQLTVKQRQIDEHNKIKPIPIDKPSNDQTEEQKGIASKLGIISEKLKVIEQQSITQMDKGAILARKLKSIQNVRERIGLLVRSFNQFKEDTESDLDVLDIKITEIVNVTIDNHQLDQLWDAIPIEQEQLKTAIDKGEQDKIELKNVQLSLNKKLDGPQLLYQQNLKEIETWENKLNELTGEADAPETLMGINARIAQLNELPKRLAEFQEKRMKLSDDIFNILDSQRQAREELFKPVQDLIKGNNLIREEYRLQFLAMLVGTSDVVSDELFSLIKQNSGDLRGDESYNTVRNIVEKYDFNNKENVLSFIAELHDKIDGAAKSNNKTVIGISSIMRKDKESSEVYDMLYGLTFLKPRYSLLFQDTRIEQLSPGQRGALLLIFYLLVDKGRNPIILDQPEENLDNETVVNLLAPVLTEAKKKRQIIMVTHNPNLAVYCDAEQIIYSNFDRADSSKITYSSGSIENPAINARVVDVLEGTMPAFNNRRIKYH